MPYLPRPTLTLTLSLCLCITLGFASASTIRIRKNLVNNSSFENVADEKPVSWHWSGGRANATMKIDDTVAHNGKRSLFLKNTTPKAPNVYSSLISSVRLVPKTTYTLSLWYRSKNPGVAWIGGGHAWRIRAYLKPTNNQWQRLTKTFKAKPEERTFQLMINTDSPTGGIWIDDVQIEEGDHATDYETEPTVEPGQTILQLQKAEPRPNLLPNGSFEELDRPDRLKHWQWHKGKADATMTIDTAEAHTGKRSIRIENKTARKAHIFGNLNFGGNVEVKPNTTYTLSCYVKGDSIQGAWFGGGKAWLVRCRFPNTTHGRWERMSTTFKTGSDTTKIPILIVTEDVAEPFWVDDIQLVEGKHPAPTIDPLAKDRPVLYAELPGAMAVRHRGSLVVTTWNPTRFPRDQFHFTQNTLWAEGWLFVPKALKNTVLSATLKSGGETLAQKTLEGDLTPGNYMLTFGTYLEENTKDIEVDIQLRSAGQSTAKPLAQTSFKRHLITTGNIKQQLYKVTKLRDQLAVRIEKIKATQRDPAYLLATLTMVNRFLQYAKQDLDKGQLARAYDAALEMKTTVEKSLQRDFLPPVPRYQTAAQGRSYRLDGPAQLGTVRLPNGQILKDYPIQFLGVGHFGQAQRDIEVLNDFGMNIIQIELGPRSILRGEHRIETKDIARYLGYLDRAKASNVAICLLLSPHYFPDWAMKKYPHLADAGGGFLKYDVHAPEARAVIEKYLRIIIPRIKDHPALHSLCISNEPVFCNTEKNRFVKQRWHQWLKNKYQSVSQLNQAWGVTYPSFSNVPVPKTEFRPTPICYDFVQFNQEAFAEWHAWMADIIHEIAPEMPVHSKIMMHAHFQQNQHGTWSIAPELFSQLSDFHGNDDFKAYTPQSSTWASSWFLENAGYDYQRSNGDKPIFNTENHLIRDRDFDYIPPEHVFNVFWQGAIHGQSATATWVWERTESVTADTAGSILHRPGCVDAMGRAGLDLMRLAPEVTALQKTMPQIAILWSDATMVRRQDCITPIRNAYEALNFQGVPVGFINDRQLATFVKTGRWPERLRNVKMIVASSATHVPETNLQGLDYFEKQGGKVLCIGECFRENEYGKPFQRSYSFRSAMPEPDNSKELFGKLPSLLAEITFHRPVRLVDTEGNPVWGVEYLSAVHNGKTIVNLCNYLPEPCTIRVLRADGQSTSGRDLLTGKTFDKSCTLQPLESRLIELD